MCAKIILVASGSVGARVYAEALTVCHILG